MINNWAYNNVSIFKKKTIKLINNKLRLKKNKLENQCDN